MEEGGHGHLSTIPEPAWSDGILSQDSGCSDRYSEGKFSHISQNRYNLRHCTLKF
jgi:hypothetical protein